MSEQFKPGEKEPTYPTLNTVELIQNPSLAEKSVGAAISYALAEDSVSRRMVVLKSLSEPALYQNQELMDRGDLSLHLVRGMRNRLNLAIASIGLSSNDEVKQKAIKTLLDGLDIECPVATNFGLIKAETHDLIIELVATLANATTNSDIKDLVSQQLLVYSQKPLSEHKPDTIVHLLSGTRSSHERAAECAGTMVLRPSNNTET